IEFLASDRMRGRDTPSPELELAASYLVNQYKLWGLQPGGENNTFYQWWPYPLRRLRASAAGLELRGAAGSQRLQLGRDFFARGGTAQPISSAGVVYAGRAADGMLAAGSMSGRVVVTALPGAGGTRDWRIERNRQMGAAQRAGASAIVYVLEPTWTADSIAAYTRQTAAGARSLGGEAAFPQYFVTWPAAQQMFRAAGMTVDDPWRGAVPAAPAVLAGLTASGALPMENADDRNAPNVVAILPGSDPALRNEYVVLSAHMDHVGVGRPVNGDSIYNGADDDASGTTGLLEVAEAFARLGVRPRRSIIFLHVSGEEKGLLGSEWFSEHPTVPLGQIVANVNVDMIGRNSPDSVVVIGKNYSTLGQTANAVGRTHPELRLTLSDDIWPQERFFFRSDHYNFARKEVPAIFFFSGVHPDYHLPSDEVERIDTDKAARISRMVFYLVHEIANAQERPRWDPRGLEEVRRMTR
ncbi:MAG TPA: M20/M25/M40 family metallo-hydrolase, partial [Longimicrobium sp.]|uniref:M20/M25/M40 family metallo-hydrolase n=1 Tax=Longimicrobium sp. TaxID=2029185 RepID=UPI002ED7C589